MHGPANAARTHRSTGRASTLVSAAWAGTTAVIRWPASRYRTGTGRRTLEDGPARRLARSRRRCRVGRPRTRLRHNHATYRRCRCFHNGSFLHNWRRWRRRWYCRRWRRSVDRWPRHNHTLGWRRAARNRRTFPCGLTWTCSATKRWSRNNWPLCRRHDGRGLPRLRNDTAARSIRGRVIGTRLRDAQRRHQGCRMWIACWKRSRRGRCLAHGSRSGCRYNGRRHWTQCHHCRRRRSSRHGSRCHHARSWRRCNYRSRCRRWSSHRGSWGRRRGRLGRNRSGCRHNRASRRGRHHRHCRALRSRDRRPGILSALLCLTPLKNCARNVTRFGSTREVHLLPCLRLLRCAARRPASTGNVATHLLCLVLFNGRAVRLLFRYTDRRKRVKNALALDLKLTCQIIDPYFTQSVLVPTFAPLAAHKNPNGSFRCRGCLTCLLIIA